MTNELPVGQLFSHVYLSGGPLLRDKETFRRRLGVYCQQSFYHDNTQLGNFLTVETGLQIGGYTSYDFEKFFDSTEIRNVLNVITLIWRFCRSSTHLSINAKRWYAFVARALKEENMGYRLDEQCGVHFFVDEAFERSRQSIIPALGQARYTGVLVAFEGAYRALDNEPQDTKQAVRLIFEAVEILAKLIHQKVARLDNQAIESIRDQAKASYNGDKTACSVADKMFAGFVDWMNGLHFYRHGQGVEKSVMPPLDMAIFAISSGTGYLRWLIEIDARSQNSKRAQ